MTLTLVPPEVDPSFLITRIAKAQDANGTTLWQLVQASDVAPPQYGVLGPLGTDLKMTYFAPDLVLETTKVSIVVSAPLAGAPGTPGEVPPGEFELGTFVITLLPPDASLTVLASAFPNSITVDGNGGPSATTSTLRAEIAGGTFLPGDLYEVFWTVEGQPLTAAGTYEPIFLEDSDGDGVDDLIVSEKTVTASQLEALVGITGVVICNVTARDAVGAEMNDVVYVTVNAPLTVAAVISPEVFVGDGELRTLLSANVSGGAGGYRFQWVSDPAIAGLFDEVDTTAQYISFRARDLGDQQVSFSVTVTDAAGNTATAIARRGGGQDPDPPAPIPDDLVVSIANPPVCVVINGTVALDGEATGGVAPLGFHWTSACGTFASPTDEDTDWTAPADPQTCAMTFTATDANGLTRSQTIAVVAAQPSVMFLASHSTTEAEAVVAANPNGHQVGVVLSLPEGCSLQLPVTVDVIDLGTGSASAAAGDYLALTVPTTVTFPAGSVGGDVQLVDVMVQDDQIEEDAETIALQLANPTGEAALGSIIDHVVTITDDDAAGLVVTSPLLGPVVEGSTVDLLVHLSSMPLADVTVGLTPDSQVSLSAASLVFTSANHATDQTVTITAVDDAVVEGPHTATITLAASSTDPAYGGITAPDVTVQITDNDSATIDVSDAQPNPAGNPAKTVDEGGSAAFTVSLSSPCAREVKVLATTIAGTATDSDYIYRTEVLRFAPGDTADKTFTVATIDDDMDEADESFFVSLSLLEDGGATIGTGQGECIIRGADTVPDISITDVSVDEASGEQAVFVVNLSVPSGRVVSVQLDANDETAVAGSDYADVSQLLVFQPGETFKVIPVAILGDDLSESDETFTVDLTAPVNATIADAQGVCTISDDDVPQISIDADRNGSEGTSPMTFTVRLSKALAAGQPDLTVNFATADGTATAGLDYLSMNTLVSFAPGDLTKTVDVTILSDTADEENETFTVTLSAASAGEIVPGANVRTGLILDDDGAPQVRILAGASLDENDPAGQMEFTVELIGTTNQVVTVDWSTAEGTAQAGEDYLSSTGVVTIAPPATSAVLTVPVVDDALDEENEQFFVTLTSATNAEIGVGQAAGTILDDDDPPTVVISVDPTSGGEGDPPQKRAVAVTIDLSGPSGRTASAVCRNEHFGPAAPGIDYVPLAEQVIFLPGETHKSLLLLILPDDEPEADETVAVQLVYLNNLSTAGGTPSATYTIIDDD